MKIISCFAFAAFLFVSCNNNPKEEKPVPVSVIFDTDIGNDIDDVLALQMLFDYEKRQKVKLLGITISKSYPRVIDYIDGYCRLHGHADIPLGYAYNGVNPEPRRYVPATLDTTIDGKKLLFPQRSIADSLPEGYKLIRQLLAKEPDHSVVLVVVGPETNIARLLQSGADEHSQLNGVGLVKQKVKLVSVMGGVYTNEFNFPEWNIVQDLEAAKILFAQCPVPVVASGFEIGDKFRYPAKSIQNDFGGGHANPLVMSYITYDTMPYERQTWDLTSVLYAVEPEKAWFDLSPKGKITIEADGKSSFAEGKGEQQYLIYKNNQQPVLNRLVELVTGKSTENKDQH
ncbi:nucleoside hydrolase [Pseudoflavitalea rhizosphaerae]|uniref:nucleoside hydrolase n=1 Tax=Pseudoflavitalea rhizosphaerae TaxID=1884793 RepID=UPI000F8EF8CD|nr:nucleoside hydrolase [Pseudoflavitalea rhizosphaerae]